jgi:diguanylate cyclase (GGDEF)-like protein
MAVLPYSLTAANDNAGATSVVTTCRDKKTMAEDGDLTAPRKPGRSPRERARALAFELAREVQTPDSGLAGDISRLIYEAERKGWPDVARIGLYAQAAGAFFAADGTVSTAIERLIDRCEVDNAHVMTALALAMRASVPAGEQRRSPAQTDDDLVRATVLLETPGGHSDERIAAHTACGIAYNERSLWELANEHFSAALEEARSSSMRGVRMASIFFNFAALQIGWACGLRQLADQRGAEERWRLGASAIAAAKDVDMPDSWRIELEAIGVLLAAIAGRDVAASADGLLGRLTDEVVADPVPARLLHLADALSDADAGRDGAAAAIEDFIAAGSEPGNDPHTRELAFFLAAELEATVGFTAGLRCAREQFAQRWNSRLTALESMRSRLQAERLRSEHAVLTRQVRLDELTGLANRRGQQRYLSGLRRARVESIAVLMVDVDEFKAVNDNFGHAVGDLALVTVARVIENAIRPGDLAVRLGGDEFAAILAGADLAAGRDRAQAISDGVAALSLHEVAPTLQLSVSIGVTAGDPAQIADLATQADAALYRAKAHERHRIVSTATAVPRAEARRPGSRVRSRLESLTMAERDVLLLMARGLLDDEIAYELASSEDTAREAVSGVLAKLGLRDRSHAVILAYEMGVVETPW